MAKRVTTQELAKEIEIIKDNHLTHMADDIDELKEAVKDNRQFFIERLDRLDNRIWLILGATFSTLITILGAIFSGIM
tara:strand:- start:201 stop:434 length:234 start_codon:yes stop_codon:yes gene_type:complete